jgi:hypothetical protein
MATCAPPHGRYCDIPSLPISQTRSNIAITIAIDESDASRAVNFLIQERDESLRSIGDSTRWMHCLRSRFAVT